MNTLYIIDCLKPLLPKSTWHVGSSAVMTKLNTVTGATVDFSADVDLLVGSASEEDIQKLTNHLRKITGGCVQSLSRKHYTYRLHIFNNRTVDLIFCRKHKVENVISEFYSKAVQYGRNIHTNEEIMTSGFLDILEGTNSVIDVDCTNIKHNYGENTITKMGKKAGRLKRAFECALNRKFTIEIKA